MGFVPALLITASLGLQAPGTVASDTIRDQDVRPLFERARQAWSRPAGGSRVTGPVREAVLVSFPDPVRTRRRRAALVQERSGRFWWSTGGDARLGWSEVRRGAPVVGVGSEPRLPPTAVDGPFPFELGGDSLAIGARLFVHPLGRLGPAHYRFHSGDTVRATLGPGTSPVELVRVESLPRAPGPRVLIATLWIDAGTGALARARYRVPTPPAEAGPDAEGGQAQGPGKSAGGAETPRAPGATPELPDSRILLDRPIGIRITAVDVAYRPAPDGAWLPHRMDGYGHVRVGQTVRMPLAWTWTFGKPDMGPEPTDLTPLLRSSLRAGLQWNPLSGLFRYNRVEGPSLGLGWVVPVGRSTGHELALRITGRFGLADLDPKVELSGVRESRGTTLGVSLYRDVAAGNDWGDVLGLGNSVSALFFGSDGGQYYRVEGGSLFGRHRNGHLGIRWRLFAERQRSLAAKSDFSFYSLVGGDGLGANLQAEEGTVAGLAVELRGQTGFDPRRPIASTRIRAEAAAGDFHHGRLAVTAALTAPLGPLAGAVEVGAGTTSAGAPPQRHFFLGGAETVRGFRAGELRGTAFWLARAELGTRLPVLRPVLFADAAWVGAREAFGTGRPVATVGVGISLLDGSLRLEGTRVVRGEGGFGVQLYRDGLF